VSEQVDLTPLGSVLHALCAQNVGWRNALVKDNGVGAADLIPFVRLGDHQRRESTRLGRYGIGAKDAALWAGGESSRFTVTSVYGGKKRVLVVQWATLARNNWRADGATEFDAEPGDAGTTLVVQPTRPPPHGSEWDRLVSNLGYLYSPALKRGVQITLERKTRGSEPEPVPQWKLPAFDGEVIDRTLEVAGKKVHVHCGVVPHGVENPRPGLTYFHGFRVILTNCLRGCGSYTATQVCGYVGLDSGWKLAKNKDEIIDDCEALYAAVELACKPVLERAHKLGMQMQSSAFEAKVSDALTAALGGMAKAKREPASADGSKKPTGCGGKHKRAAKEQDGDKFRRRLGANIRVVHQNLGGLWARQRRAIELEENLRRKDLTPYERSKFTVERAGAAKDAEAEELRSKSDHKKNGRGRPKAASQRAAAARTGTPKTTIQNAERHVEIADRFTFMQAPDWTQAAFPKTC